MSFMAGSVAVKLRHLQHAGATDMPLRLKLPSLLALAVLALAPPAHSQSVPAGRTLDFDIVRKGDVIGHYHTEFIERQDHRLQVLTRIDAAVSAGPIRLYHFRHQSTETWADGRLVAFSGDTDDDGEQHRLEVASGPNGLQVTVDGKAAVQVADAVPSSLWNRAMLDGRRPVFDIGDGQLLRTESHCGADVVPTGAKAAASCRVEGDLIRTLDYDADGLLAGLSFPAEDGSKVMYR
jgi:hypothetical protein